MEQQIRELIIKIDDLEKLINVIQQNLNSNIQIFLACLALIVATAGAALVNYVKVTVDKRVEKELNKKIEQIKSEIRDEIRLDNYKHLD